MARLRVPPGRAGRLWLRNRLDVAEHGVALLERKLRILAGEQRRMRMLADDTRREWEQTSADARTWLLRAALTGGQRSLRLATGAEPAGVVIRWMSVMGVRYPGQATCTPPARDEGTAIVGNAALVHAEAAHRAALVAAVRHAAAQAAVRVLDTELATTQVRARALRRHWIPRLQAALARSELALEEQERAEGTRRRWAAGAAAGQEERR